MSQEPIPAKAAPDRSHRAGQRRAAGIYGTVITAAVLAAAGAHLSTAALAIAVLVTLLVYWMAEQYAEILGEQAARGRLPGWPRIREGLANTWPMVSASYLPVLVVVICRVAGMAPTPAANVALAAAVVLLLVHGWAAGRAAEMRGVRLLIVTSIAGALGVLMIILKNFVVTNLH